MKAIFLLLVLSSTSYALDNKMLAKDLWVKKHVPIIAHDLCEGQIAMCMGGFQDDCAAVYQPAVQACADQIFSSLPEYISGKEATQRYSHQIGDCARPKLTDVVVRKIMANPKVVRKERCLGLVQPKNPPTPSGGPLKLGTPGTGK